MRPKASRRGHRRRLRAQLLRPRAHDVDSAVPLRRATKTGSLQTVSAPKPRVFEEPVPRHRRVGPRLPSPSHKYDTSSYITQPPRSAVIRVIEATCRRKMRLAITVYQAFGAPTRASTFLRLPALIAEVPGQSLNRIRGQLRISKLHHRRNPARRLSEISRPPVLGVDPCLLE